MVLLELKQYQEFLNKALKLAANGAYDEQLRLKVDGKFQDGTNIIDYILEKSDGKFSKEYEKYLLSQKIYTKLSPTVLRINKNKSARLFPI